MDEVDKPFGIRGFLIDTPEMGMVRAHPKGAVVIHKGRISEMGDYDDLRRKQRPRPLEWIDRGPVTGAVDVKVKGLPKALSYNLQYAVVTNPGTLPTSWTTLTLPGSKKLTISNLTPGATYAFQVRALGRLGYTDWSNPITFICG